MLSIEIVYLKSLKHITTLTYEDGIASMMNGICISLSIVS